MLGKKSATMNSQWINKKYVVNNSGLESFAWLIAANRTNPDHNYQDQ